MSLLLKLSIKRLLGYEKTTSSCQELRSPKPTDPEVAAFEERPDVSPKPEYGLIEDQLACFQYVGNIFKRGGGF